MRQHSQLDLRIVRIHEDAAFPWDKDLSDPSSQFHAHRNILQVRFGAADPAGRRDRLVKIAVDPPVFCNTDRKSVRIGGF